MIRPARPTLAEVLLADLFLYSMSHITKSLIEELEHAPESVQREVLAFLRHLRARGAGNDGSEDVHALLPLTQRQTSWRLLLSVPLCTLIDQQLYRGVFRSM